MSIQPSSNRTPWIGVTTRHGSQEWIEKNSRNYLNTLAEYGALAIMLAPDAPARLPDGVSFTPDAEGRLPDEILSHLDGLILSGGGDVDPIYFGEELNGAIPDHIDRRRDELELHLARASLEADLPLFGICRGCQVLNVAAGGGMIQHFDGHRSPKEATAFHDVTLCAGSGFRS
ncbi:MAG: C26 family cysteine hydrolase domain-containing family [Caldilineaceae bacterium]|nr:C26 family cysteine hydrolase domain-containing family [Caldilineaceae bacterium]